MGEAGQEQSIQIGPGWWRASDGDWYPPRWEYHWATGLFGQLPHKRHPDIEDVLADLGSQGWEAVTMTDSGGGHVRVLMKRPIRP